MNKAVKHLQENYSHPDLEFGFDDFGNPIVIHRKYGIRPIEVKGSTVNGCLIINGIIKINYRIGESGEYEFSAVITKLSEAMGPDHSKLPEHIRKEMIDNKFSVISSKSNGQEKNIAASINPKSPTHKVVKVGVYSKDKSVYVESETSFQVIPIEEYQLAIKTALKKTSKG